MRDVVGVVLGAGRSSRFGAPKQLLPFEGTTLLGRVVENANASDLDRVVVVLGRASEELRGSLDFGREVVDNAVYGTGCEALVLLLGDQPGVRPGFIDMAPSRWRRERPWASVTSYRGELGHPFVLARGAFGDLRHLHEDKAVWKQLIEAYPERGSRTQIDAALPPDMDTPEGHELALSHQRSTGAS